MLDQSLPEARSVETRANTAPIVAARNTILRLPRILALIPILLILLVAGTIYIYNASNQGKVFPGVKVGDLDLGGKDAATLRAALTTRYADVNANRTGVNLSYADKQWQLNADQVGFSLDVDKTVAAAIAVGRSGDFFSDLGQQWTAFRSGVQLQPTWLYDQSTMPKLLAKLHQEIDRPAINASMNIAADGRITLNKAQTGRKVDDSATAANIAAALDSKGDANPRALVVVSEIAPAITDADWEAARVTATRAVLPITLHFGDNFEYVINTAELAPMLILSPAAGSQPASLSLDNAQLTALAERIAPQIYRAPTDAAFQLDTTAAVARVTPEQAGQQLDVAATVAAINQAAFKEQDRNVLLPTTSLEPKIKAASYTDVVNRANELIAGFTLNYSGGPWTIQGERMAVMLQLKRDDSSGKSSFSLSFDQAELARKLGVIAQSTDRIATAPVYRLGSDNRPYAATPAVDGRKMDIAATIIAINTALQNGGNAAEVSFATSPTPVYDLTQPLDFPDKLAEATTSIAGSSANRRFNVTLGTNNFNNTLIPPGGIYSASDAFGPIDEANGFQTGYAIVRVAGNISTQPTVGGGICQVATTFFQAAWWSGLQVVQRSSHSYWISSYGKPPLGRVGLDATVFQYDVDLKMKNTTGNWILVRSWVSEKDSLVHFQLLGTNPNWNISVTNPIITNVVKTDPKPVYENSDKLAVGTQNLVERAQDGFDASISRTITDASGKVIDQLTLNSHYAPAYNRYLVGTMPVAGKSAGSPPPPAATPPTDTAGNPAAETSPTPAP